VLLIASILLTWIPFLGWFIISAIVLILAVIGIIQSLNGNYWKMPVLGGLAEKFNF
jgi:uncharacterized membrane protein